jgi:hypothetical protein
MAREFFWFGIGAVFGLGAALMALAAPLYFPNAPNATWHYLFWGGIALMILMIIDGVGLAAWTEDGRPASSTATRSKFTGHAFAFGALMHLRAISFAVAMTAFNIDAGPRPRTTWTRSWLIDRYIARLSAWTNIAARSPSVRLRALTLATG